MSDLAPLQAAYLDEFRTWWATEHPDDPRAAEEVLTAVASRFLHVTLGWIDRLSSSLAPSDWDRLVEALGQQYRAVEPFTIFVGPAWPHTCAVEAWVQPDPRLEALPACTRSALRECFGADAAPESQRPWRPHVALGYAAADMDTETLAGSLSRTECPTGQLVRPQPVEITSVLVVDNDTFPADDAGLRWDESTARSIPLGSA